MLRGIMYLVVALVATVVTLMIKMVVWKIPTKSLGDTLTHAEEMGGEGTAVIMVALNWVAFTP